jgi:hypothetical protein
MKISNMEFQFVSLLVAERDSYGHIIEYLPATRYNNTKHYPLNAWGEGPFCHFRLEPKSWEVLGAYAITDESDKVLYLGKCTGRTSTLAKRFNNGYGSIQPRNCYKGGQSTNCRINHLVLGKNKSGNKLRLFFHETNNGQEAGDLEGNLIRQIGKPPWNINEPW